MTRKILVLGGAALGAALPLRGAGPPPHPFLERTCLGCHDGGVKKGGLDLSALRFDPADAANFTTWVKVHDRARSGEMPPDTEERPDAHALTQFTQALSAELAHADHARVARDGRATRRRLNRYEYENTLRDLLHAPWLQVKEFLPEDGELDRFNKSGERLDISHVQMARYLEAADHALREVIATHATRPPTRTVRYHARDQFNFTWPMKDSLTHPKPERATFPVLGFAGQPEVRAGEVPRTVGADDPVTRDLEGMGVIASSYEPLELLFEKFRAQVAGRYRLRFMTHSVWVGPGQGEKWFIANLDEVAKGRRSEPVTIYGESPPGLLRHLGDFDAHPEPAVQELDVWLLPGESIRPDASRLVRSRPGSERWRNPFAAHDGQPGVVFRWLEVEGPLYDSWPAAGHKLLFGDLPLAERTPETLSADDLGERTGKEYDRYIPYAPPGGMRVVSRMPQRDAARLLRGFIDRAYRRTTGTREAQRFLPVVEQALATGHEFTEAMIAGYTAVLCSPEFLYLDERPGPLDDFALASRLAFFLWNSPPDDELRTLAAQQRLHQPAVLHAQTERLLADHKSWRFVEAFLDYWLDLRRIGATAPDVSLYPDYYLDDLLSESALEETRRFFAEVLTRDLPVRTLIDADFAMLNERLAVHYELPRVEGVAIRRVPLPAGHVRGGLLTQASVLKVTANGTTTSPVVRGAWVMERILGQKPPPPPPGFGAVEPDIRGATTVREQLDRHRSVPSCQACHAKIDPAGFALEAFDVLGGWRERYRAIGDGTPATGLGKNGQKFPFHLGPPVDDSGQLPDGQAFADVRELKRLLLADEAQIARALARHFTIYATGAPVAFGDRAAIERVIERSAANGYGARSLIHALIASELFLHK